MDEIAKEYDVIVLGTGMPLSPASALLFESPRIPSKLGNLCDGRTDGELSVLMLC